MVKDAKDIAKTQTLSTGPRKVDQGFTASLWVMFIAGKRALVPYT